MIGPDGKKLRGRVRRMVDEALTTLGPDLLFAGFTEYLSQQGITPCKESTFYQYRAVWRRKRRTSMEPGTKGEEPTWEEGSPNGTPLLEERPSRREILEDYIRAQPRDGLSDFLRFAAVVEAIGGTKRARKYLLLLDQVKEIH